MADASVRRRGEELPVGASLERAFEFDDRDFARICKLIHQRAGISLGPHKRDMVYSRLVRRLRTHGLTRFGDYLDLLEFRGDADEWQAFVNCLTTNLTSFFREAYHFEALIAQLREVHARQRGSEPLRIWCSAASTGEEPWSLAITACEAFGTMTPPVRILATDIDTQVLETAERGVYTIDRIANLSEERKQTFFQRGSGPNAGQCRVKPALRELVEFEPLNLLDPSYGVVPGLTAIFCRNVMIYFDKPTQYQVLARMRPLLSSDGRLYAGHSESFNHAADLFTGCGRTIYMPRR
ncbi:chemotaxis protein CheR [Lysobacter sp. TY2-98]|uniref:CheR family methyltransferase n=1 Tax=Lysobacter sp. TY2-98 TaxID=2290922 RepID=UPI000E20288E|nr:CheR family methyltransferase [Lysobacter sp. TY2-98]AXK71161.1 chemotaxis protein CheR [Lysobacter sp. TY2-98]